MAIDKRIITDTLLKSGKGEIQVVINGSVEKLATVTSVSIPYKANTSQLTFIESGDYTQVEGYQKTGKMEIAYSVSIMRDFVANLGDGKDIPVGTLILENKGSDTVGNQRLVFSDVVFTSFSIFQSQAKGTMTETVEFTYSDFKVTDRFTRQKYI